MTFAFASTNRTRVAAAVFAMALAVVAVFAVIDPAQAETPGLLMLIAGHTTAGILFLRRSRQLNSADRGAWIGLAVALFCGGGGVLVLGLLSQFGYEAPAFGPVDIVFLGGYAAMITGLALLARRGTAGSGWVVTIVDTAVAAVALATFVWLGIGHSLVEVLQDADPVSRIIGPIYPILDTAVAVGLIAMSIRRTAFRLDPKLIVLSVGLAVQIVADFLFLVEGVGVSFVDTSPRLDLFLLSSACYVTVGVLFDPTRTAREFPDRDVSALALIWPYFLGSGVIGMHVVGLWRLGVPTDQLVTLLGALAVGMLVFVRQSIAIRNTQRRVEQQRRELISSVSHEIRTPLTGLIGYLELLADSGDMIEPEECHEMLQIASDEAAQLGRVITDMVAMARDDGRGLAVAMKDTSLGEICRSAIAAHPGLQIDLEVEDEAIHADHHRLVQALSNLLANAEKYGDGQVEVAARRLGNEVTFEIHDDGPGVPLRFQQRVFEQFERGSHRFDAGTPGMGVGLAIVKAIALAHGGDTGYRRSESLGGACFWITVAAAPAPSANVFQAARLAPESLAS